MLPSLLWLYKRMNSIVEIETPVHGNGSCIGLYKSTVGRSIAAIGLFCFSSWIYLLMEVIQQRF